LGRRACKRANLVNIDANVDRNECFAEDKMGLYSYMDRPCIAKVDQFRVCCFLP